jgi:hypothetical protein
MAKSGWQTDQRKTPSRFAAKAGRASAPPRQVPKTWSGEATAVSKKFHEESDRRQPYAHSVCVGKEPTARK